MKSTPQLMQENDGEQPAFTIGFLESSQLPELNAAFPQTPHHMNTDRLAEQEAGNSAYLVATEGGKITGKAYLKYRGSNDEIVKSQIHNCPDLENVEVMEEMRGKGFGTKILEYAEQLCREQGFHQIGLGVALENEQARKLYERLGYQQVLEPFTISFPWIDSSGTVHQLSEDVAYLVKEL